jgi:hypothetical protein
MTRHRWLRAEWPMTVRALAKRVRLQEFTEERGSGFILDRVRDDEFEARFVERYEYTETISDPYGRELTFDRLEFRQTVFRATTEWPGLELLDAPRSTLRLTNGLLAASNFELAVSPIDVNVLAWSDELQRALGVEAVIDSIQVAALAVGDGIKAKVMIKGEKDVRNVCKEMVQGRKHVLEKLQLRIIVGGILTTVVLTNGAGAKVVGIDIPVELVTQLRTSIPKAPLRQ